MSWTEARIDKLKKLNMEGLKCSEIASRIGASRNAVIGKLFRLGLTKTKSPERINAARSVGARKAWASAPKRQQRIQKLRETVESKRSPLTNLFLSTAHTATLEPLPRPSINDVARVSFEVLEPHHCKFPVGDPKQEGFGFCGDPRATGLPYCETHALRCCHPGALRRLRPPAEPKSALEELRLKEFA